ncbi:FAM214A family protein [Megaselia abdita]
MIPTTASTSSSVAQNLSTAMLGIASVILEGRAVSDDDFILADQPCNGIHHFQRLQAKLGQLKQTSPNRDHDIFSSQISIHSTLDDKPLLSLQSLVTTSLCSTPRSAFDTRFCENQQRTDFGSSLSEYMSSENSCNIKTTILSKSAPKQGPHCEQFLKKIGILQNTDISNDQEDHICDTSIVNEICYNWRIHCLEIDTITSRDKPICIEVYLGPESDAILLEQWIIEYNNKSINPLMNLSSLCTAIRSQLYFSQITAWSELIRKTYNHELHSTGRFKYSNARNSNNWWKKPRLDIFYRIKPYDYSCLPYFKSKPIIHKFPEVIINNNYGLSVSLVSLPRIQEIPMANFKKSSLEWTQSKPFIDDINLDDCKYGNNSNNFKEMRELNCISSGDESEDLVFNDSELNSTAIHREKQVIKYKRLMKKRDNGKRKSATNNSLQNLSEFCSINSNRPPLYQVISKNSPDSVQSQNVEMISIGTQTISCTNTPCESCGTIISTLCLKCDSINNQKKKESLLKEEDKTVKDSKIDSAELLLNAIQRTPKNKKCSKEKKHIRCSSNSKTINLFNENDCIVCKRQKTQHTYQNEKESNNNFSGVVSNYNLRNFECDCNNSSIIGQELFNEEFYPSPSTQFKTPKNKTLNESVHKNLTKLSANGEAPMDISSVHVPNLFLSSRKLIPKVNLSQIFCNPSVEPNRTLSSSTLPITIRKYFNFDCDFSIQKTNSAPSLPLTQISCLSPRLKKPSVAHNFRRTRHYSEKSSIGSDEQLSDEDLDFLGFGICNTNEDSLMSKNRYFSKPSRSLLGNLEESLFQKRITPQQYVSGFKILLGASGGFCPPQVTIPAASYFYELKGQTLNTPYVCEVRMPRKGYKIPLKGNIQATLLNPEGTVVRMFVIYYDLQDMPPLHQTFIRQRILVGSHLDFLKDTLSPSSMKFLRYSIHLRFQTSKSGRMSLHSDVRILVSRKTDCDTAAAHAKGDIESPKELTIMTVTPDGPKYSSRHDIGSIN